MSTLRILFPQWQGGMNPNYYFGGELLSFIAPNAHNDETVRIAVSTDFEHAVEAEPGQISREAYLLNELIEAKSILKDKQPDKVIVFGGDCSVSQAPFDYLSGKYGEELGVLWLDAHPDISTVKDTRYYHEMILANIIGYGRSVLEEQMENPVEKRRVMYAGLIESELRHMDRAAHELGMRIATPEMLQEGNEPIVSWIREEGISKLAVHFDLDVLDREDFRSNTCAMPHTTKAEYGSAMGIMSLKQITDILIAVNKEAEIAGITIAEHMPWDAINLRKALSKLSIFQ